jgi:hypothetical protein
VQLKVRRYTLDKVFVETGNLQVHEDGASTLLTYSDSNISIRAMGLNHPIRALENLRIQLQVEFNSILAIKGCRIDTDYRPTGTFRCYILEQGKSSTKLVSLFDRTRAIDKLCTVEEHKAAYKKWCESL